MYLGNNLFIRAALSKLKHVVFCKCGADSLYKTSVQSYSPTLSHWCFTAELALKTTVGAVHGFFLVWVSSSLRNAF